MICMTCGHSVKLHGAVLDPAWGKVICTYHDSEGLCRCPRYVPCDHVPRSIASRNGHRIKVCCCGLHEERYEQQEPTPA